MKVTAPMRTHDVRVGDIIEVPDGTEGEVTQILDKGHLVVFRIEAVPGLVAPSYHILRDDEPVTIVLEDDGEPTDVEIYGAGVR
jgi:hypothetical protein